MADRRKLALIIVNSKYHSSANRLDPSDQIGADLSDALKQIGFDVHVATDVKKRDMTVCIIELAEMMEDADLALVYFAGHAYEVKGTMYWIPVPDEWIRTDRDVEDFAVDFNRMLRRFQGRNPSSAHVFVLDCCRPYVGREADGECARIQSQGLSAMEPVDRVLLQLAYAAKATTQENRFVKHLLENIARENVTVTKLFEEIVDEVKRESERTQKPLSINELKHDEEIYLNYVPASLLKTINNILLGALLFGFAAIYEITLSF